MDSDENSRLKLINKTGSGGERRGQTALGGNQEGAVKIRVIMAKMGVIRGHQASRNFSGGKTAVHPGCQ